MIHRSIQDQIDAIASLRTLTWKRLLVLGFDVFAIAGAYFMAFLLRFDFNIPPNYLNLMLNEAWIVLGTQIAVFLLQGVSRTVWSFTGLRDMYLILRAAILAVCTSGIAAWIFNPSQIGWPRSIFFLNTLILLGLSGGARFAYRIWREVVRPGIRRRKRVLLIGAGQTGSLIAREFARNLDTPIQIIGFLDDHPKYIGTTIHSAPVLGPLSSLPKWLDKLKPEEIVIAIPGLPGPKVRPLLQEAQQRGIACRIAPPIQDVLAGKIRLSHLREVRVEDLLRRDVVTVDDEKLCAFFSGKRVLVTGAGGSIGSELCRQVLKYNPSELILYERTEYNLYRFDQELKRSHHSDLGKIQTNIHPIIGDVLDERRLSQIFEKYRPDLVFHAAAYKHVPLMEENAYESILNNVVGTYRVLRACELFQVKKFILVSTDKAVRPTSIMGATKRMAEQVACSFSSQEGLNVAAVRFGNVLDSEGSVLPLFREQIQRGGPITITHPDVTRYFMTIPEASSLVLEASRLSRGRDVFLLDMGEPFRIVELAEELVRLCGLRPYEDIEFKWTGLRKGEKLFEELFIDFAQSEKTQHPKILSSKTDLKGSLPEDWRSRLESFGSKEEIPDENELISWITHWVPEYTGRAISVHENASTATQENVSRYVH